MAERNAELEAANERSAALEDAVNKKSSSKEVTKEQLEIVKLESRVKEVQKKADALREALDKEQGLVRDLRADVMRETAHAKQLAERLAEREAECARGEAALQRALAQYTRTVASLQAQLGLEAEGLRTDLVDARADPDVDPDVEWPKHCAELDAGLAAAVGQQQERIAAFPAQLQEAQDKAQGERERLRARYETRIEQLKEKLTRKDKSMAEFDGQLAQLSQTREQLAQAQTTIKTLEEEIALLKRKLGEQKTHLEQLRGKLQDQEHLRDVLLRNQDFRSSQQLTSDTLKKPTHDCVTVDELQAQLRDLRRSFQAKLKEKDAEIATLQDQHAEARRLVRLASTSPGARTATASS